MKRSPITAGRRAFSMGRTVASAKTLLHSRSPKSTSLWKVWAVMPHSSDERFVRLILLACCAGVVLSSVAAPAQTIPSPSSPADSIAALAADSALAAWSAAADYEIARLRLQRWLLRPQDQAAAEQVAELLQDAESFAAQGDWVTAKLLLEVAGDLIAPEEQVLVKETRRQGDKETKSQSAKEARSQGDKEAKGIEDKIAWRWQPEALVGVDFWRQEFEIGYAQDESLFVQNTGNPYTGLRLSVSRDIGSQSRVLAAALLKTSRDYNSGEVELRGQRALSTTLSGSLENRFETTRYLRDFDLRYWQNNAKVLLSATLNQRLKLELDDELRLRRYAREDELSRNYSQNETGLAVAFAAGIATRLRARYGYLARRHVSFDEYDYFEHRLEGSLFSTAAGGSSLYLQNLWRRRVYPRGLSDSTFENTHREEYLRADLRLATGSATAIRLEGEFTWRQYPAELDNPYTPNFLDLRLNPQFQFKLLANWQASAGYLYLLRRHEREPAATDAESFLVFEDYFSHGLTLGLDLLSLSGILLSLSNAFEIRTYPNVTSGNLIISNSYSDRNIHSLLFFLSWTLTRRWQLGAFANFDNEISRVREANDSRNTLFSMDLTYSF